MNFFESKMRTFVNSYEKMCIDLLILTKKCAHNFLNFQNISYAKLYTYKKILTYTHIIFLKRYTHAKFFTLDKRE